MIAAAEQLARVYVAMCQKDGCVMNNIEAQAAPDTTPSDDSAALVARLRDERAIAREYPPPGIALGCS
jgi:hypothetical protein